jgi:murein DD-endopeptidase MepM/ murein hydrolase activator NlpD
VLKGSLVLLLLLVSIVFFRNEAYSAIVPTENPIPEKLFVPVEFLSIMIPDRLPSENNGIVMPKLSDFEIANVLLASDSTENKTNIRVTRRQLQAPGVSNREPLFIWPVAGKRVSSNYGFRMGGNRGAIHHGIDIPMPRGTPIIAARGGVVKRADSVFRGYGKLVVINHGNGVETRYAHCSEFAVKAGDIVETGQVIAYVGSSGNSTSDHLHFEVVINGVAHNPMHFLSESPLVLASQLIKKNN